MAWINSTTKIRNVIWVNYPKNTPNGYRREAIGCFTFKGKRHKKSFRHPSKYIAITRAHVWVLDLREALGAKYSCDGPMVFKRQRGNQDLPLGICITRKKRGYGAEWFVRGYCTFNKKSVSKSFSIEKYGYSEALRLAQGWREALLKYAETQPRFGKKQPPLREDQVMEFMRGI